MSVAQLKKLTIAHLRGAVEPFELPFENGKKLTIVYGENGTGKSTICDALEFLSKGKVGSLDNRGLGKTNQYWNAVNKSAADVSVILETSESTCRAWMKKSDVVADPPEARPRVEVLRRSQILALLEARPGERYEAIRRFIDVSGIEESENMLRRQITDLQSSRNLAAARILENREAILQFWEAAGSPGTSALSWAQTEAARELSGSDPELQALRTLQGAYARLLDYPAQLASAEQARSNAHQAVVASQQQANETLKRIADDAGEIVGVLESASAYLHRHPDSQVCPLCESADAVDGLSERIAQRLQAFSTYQQIQLSKLAAESTLQRAQQQQAALLERLNHALQRFDAARAGYHWSTDIPLPERPAPYTPDALALWLADCASLPDA